jgi:hypothetical protein
VRPGPREDAEVGHVGRMYIATSLFVFGLTQSLPPTKILTEILLLLTGM